MTPVTVSPHRTSSSWLAWYFVVVWGSGFLATKLGLQYAPPFTFLTLRFTFGILLVIPIALAVRPRWPDSALQWTHVAIAGLLMHAVNLGGSHYAQYLGMSAGIAALVLALQPLVTAVVAGPFIGERLNRMQWIGVLLGFAGVALVVWHKIDLGAMSTASLAAVLIALVAITAGTLYQRRFCPMVDLRAASVVQFAATLLLIAPLAFAVEGFAFRISWQLLAAIGFLVIFASIFAVNALHTLMRRGEATRVTSLLYLTPIIAVALEWLMFGISPTWLTALGVVITCAGVAMVALKLRDKSALQQAEVPRSAT
ncbi:MAG TPA: DMT family transporter [Burkholderiaceae bacterium]|nr:DMT family transporter [Burkholderiaceae bacterium]